MVPRGGPSETNLCRQPEPLTREQLPAPVLLLPDLKRADPGGRLLAVELGFGQVDVTRDGRIADHGHLQFREREGLDHLLAGHAPVDELLLGLDPAVRMAVADLRGRDLLQLGLVGFEQALPKDLDALGDRRLVSGRCPGGAAEEEVPGPERNSTRHREVTTRYVHDSLLSDSAYRPRAPASS